MRDVAFGPRPVANAVLQDLLQRGRSADPDPKRYSSTPDCVGFETKKRYLEALVAGSFVDAAVATDGRLTYALTTLALSRLQATRTLCRLRPVVGYDPDVP
eukprot:4692545-Alexandrium_andersonii.AAC.1